MQDLLATKLHPPRSPRDCIPRTRVWKRLDLGRRQPLTLVSAAAGYGKSTTVARWLESREEPAAWVSLDHSDNDLQTFFRYMLAAIQTRFPDACVHSMALAEATSLPPVPVLAATLCNELDEVDEPLILVLDDYHWITTPAVHELVAELLRHPPLLLHLVLMTRHDPPLPLVPWRARGQVTDVRSVDLQFTSAESTAFLEGATGVALSTESLATAQAVLEGWPAGLRLLALAMHQVEDPARFLAGLMGHVQGTRDYLVTEVLRRQPDRVQARLLKTAITDRFCAPLCDALWEGGSPEADSGSSFLAWLVGSGLFVVSLDDKGTWYRFSHVFQSALREEAARRLGEAAIGELHAKAAAWFESEGLIEQSLCHALAAGDIDRAAALVERRADAALLADGWRELQKWMTQLPEAVVLDRVALVIAQAWVLWFQVRLDLLAPLLDRLAELLEAESDCQSERGQLAFFRGAICLYEGNAPQAIPYLEDAMESVAISHQVRRGELYIILLAATQAVSGTAEARHRLASLMDASPPPGPRTQAALAAAAVFVHLVAGDLAEAASWNHRFAMSARMRNAGYLRAWVEYTAGHIRLQRGEAEAATHHLQRAAHHRFSYDVRYAVDGLVGLMLAHQIGGHLEEADQALALLEQFAAATSDPEGLGLVESARVRLELMRGDRSGAVAWLQRRTAPPTEFMTILLENPALTWCRALLAEGSPASLQDAERRLREHTRRSDEQHNTYQQIRIQALLALCYDQQGMRPEAQEALDHAVTLSEPGRYLFPFLELGPPIHALLEGLLQRGGRSVAIERMLTALDAAAQAQTNTHPAGPPAARMTSIHRAIAESLTNREVEVLELLVERLYNKEIAVRLHVSQETVKSHLKSLYSKLGVASRRQAAIAATDLGLVGSPSTQPQPSALSPPLSRV